MYFVINNKICLRARLHFHNLPFHLIQLHKCLVAGRKTRGYTRYSPALFSSFIVLTDRPLQSTLEPRSRRFQQEPTTTSSSPLARSSLAVPRQEASPFRSVSLMLFVLAISKEKLD